jgi:hypothetical protein
MFAGYASAAKPKQLAPLYTTGMTERGMDRGTCDTELSRIPTRSSEFRPGVVGTDHKIILPLSNYKYTRTYIQLCFLEEASHLRSPPFPSASVIAPYFTRTLLPVSVALLESVQAANGGQSLQSDLAAEI